MSFQRCWAIENRRPNLKVWRPFRLFLHYGEAKTALAGFEMNGYAKTWKLRIVKYVPSGENK